MSALTTTAGGNSNGFALMPQNLNDAMRLADLMAKGKMVPEHLRNPSDMLMVIEQAVRWGMSPFAVAQCTASVRGKLLFEGKLVSAAINSSGVLQGRLDYEFHGEGPGRSVVVRGTMRGENKPREITVTLASAKTDNEHWKKSPDQMLTYHAARVWARRHAPEVMLGVYSPEEFEDTKTDNFRGTTIDVRPDPEQVMQPTEPPKKKRTWGDFLDELDIELANATTTAEVDEILARSEVHRAQDQLQNGAKDRLNHMLQQAIARTAQPENNAPNDEMEAAE